MLAGLHGNEPAGVRALQRLADAGARPRLTRGRLVGIVGNLGALAVGRRFVDCDLNRSFGPGNLARLASEGATLAEEHELLALLAAFSGALERSVATELVVLDLHTTSSPGADFTIVGDDPESIALARVLPPSVVLGMTGGLRGTTLDYFTTANLGLPTRTLIYEAGAHDDPQSADRAEALVGDLLQALGLTSAPQQNLAPSRAHAGPAVVRLRSVLHLGEGADFTMLPGFGNFDRVQAGQVVAYLDGESVTVDADGYLLMPLYQPQGSDGFFLVEAVE